ncbi:MAG TPA: Ku protein [Tepidiformaceae bacterium]|nr:Ku protein [Thermoflexaceae bacterium]HMS60030.1 Ku protein [Tepidiformaceae bacterium]
MPRAMWTGSISFGLVNVPVKLFTAARNRDIRFNQLHAPDHSRIQMKRFCADEQIEIPFDEIIKGIEVGGEYVVITEEEMDALAPAVTQGIEIEEFVNLSDIDPVYFEHSYYLSPEKGGAKAYALLRDAMEQAGKIALGRVVLRQKQYLVALRPAGRALAMETLFFPDEVVSQDDLDGLPKEDMAASERELKMAQQLIETLSGDFEPGKYRDEYREQLEALIEEKAAGNAPVELKPKTTAAPKVADLMAALEASIAAAKESKEPAAGRKSA